MTSSPAVAIRFPPKPASGRYPPAGVVAESATFIPVIAGARAGLRVPVHCTPSAVLIDFAGAEILLNSRPLAWSRFVTVRPTFAGTEPKLATLAVQFATPVPLAMVVGAHACVSVTTPCFLTKATGIVTEFGPAAFGSSVILPKYWPLAISGAEIVTQKSTVAPWSKWI